MLMCDTVLLLMAPIANNEVDRTLLYTTRGNNECPPLPPPPSRPHPQRKCIYRRDQRKAKNSILRTQFVFTGVRRMTRASCWRKRSTSTSTSSSSSSSSTSTRGFASGPCHFLIPPSRLPPRPLRTCCSSRNRHDRDTRLKEFSSLRSSDRKIKRAARERHRPGNGHFLGNFGGDRSPFFSTRQTTAYTAYMECP